MKKPYVPNSIGSKTRTANICLSLLLFAYGSYGVWMNDLYIPGRYKYGGKGIHLHNVSAWMMYAAIICACSVLLSVVADHYDNRDNETDYGNFAVVGVVVGLLLVVWSLAMATT